MKNTAIEKLREWCKLELQRCDSYCYCPPGCDCYGESQGKESTLENVLEQIDIIEEVLQKDRAYKKLGVRIGRYEGSGKNHITGYHAVTNVEYRRDRKPICGRKIPNTKKRFKEEKGQGLGCNKCEKAVRALSK